MFNIYTKKTVTSEDQSLPRSMFRIFFIKKNQKNLNPPPLSMQPRGLQRDPVLTSEYVQNLFLNLFFKKTSAPPPTLPMQPCCLQRDPVLDDNWCCCSLVMVPRGWGIQ